MCLFFLYFTIAVSLFIDIHLIDVGKLISRIITSEDMLSDLCPEYKTFHTNKQKCFYDKIRYKNFSDKELETRLPKVFSKTMVRSIWEI